MPLLAKTTPSGLFSSGQFGTEVRVAFLLLGFLLIGIIGHISWISETLGAAIKLAPTGLEVSIRIFVTGDSVPQQSDDVSVKSGKETPEAEWESPPPSLFEDPAVLITSGSRANLKYILQKEADLTHGRMGVTGLCYQPSAYPSPVADSEINSVWLPIYHRSSKRCPRFLNCWTVYDHEGWSQYHATY